MLDEQTFHREADEALESVRKALEPAAEEHGFEVDYNSGVLAIEFEDPSPAKFVISPNTPVRQVWVSALARSFKLEWNEDQKTFRLAETGETLRELIARLAGQHLGVGIR